MPRIAVFRVPCWGLALILGFACTAQAAPRLEIVVYGGTGHIGQRIVQEALNRGHEVVVVVRTPQASAGEKPHLRTVAGDVLDSSDVARRVAGADVVVCAVSFRKPPDYGAYRRAAESLTTALRSLGAKAPRLIVVGGAGSLEQSPGVLVADRVPPAFRGEVLGQKDALDYYRSVMDVSWTYFSPAGTIAPGKRTGEFRLGGDRLITDAKGESRISMEDYAVAVLDEAEKPAHTHQRFTIGY
jgi:putative NADH-flavin reductase